MSIIKMNCTKKLKEVGKPLLTIFFQKVITSAHSKSSNSSGFNPILQKFYEIIREIIVSKILCGIFLIFCLSSFISNFIVKNNFWEPQNHWNLNISITIYLKKISAHGFEDYTRTNKLEEFFFFFFFFKKVVFQRLGAFLATTKPLVWASFFSTKK